MKKHLFLLIISALMIFKGIAQPITAAPTPPVRSAGNVISLFSDAYTNISGTDFFPYWGQGTTVSDVSIAGNATKLYTNLDYQGLQLSSGLDVSAMQNLHLDVWTSNVSALNVYLINTPGGPAIQQSYTVSPTSGGWYSVDIALTNYNSVPLNSINQMMFTGSGTFYMDNLYFWKSANAPSLSNFSVPAKVLGDAPFTLTAPTSNSTGSFSYTSSNPSVATISGNVVTVVGVGTSTITATQAASGSFGSGTITATLVVSSPPPATAAPTPPARSASNVISLYSNAYTNVTVDTWSAVWDQADVADVTVATNATKKYTNFVFAGVEFTSSTINAINMERFHIDIWTPDATVFKVKLVDFGNDGAYGGGDDVEHELGYTPALSQWVSYDIPLTDFTGLVTRGHLAQMIFVASNSTVYIDNVYFWRSAPAPTLGTFTVPAKTVGAAPFTLTAPTSNSTGTFSYTSSNPNVATISGSTVTIIGAGTSVITATQAAAGSYGSGSTTANLVVTGPSAPLTAAPTPAPRNAGDVISLFSEAYTNVAGTNWFPWWWQNAMCEDTTIAGNLTHKYPNLNYHGVQFADVIDASGMSKLHFDIWTADCAAFDFYLINNTTTGLEKKITVNPAFAGWQSYDIDLTQFSSQGIDLQNIGQFKFVSTPFGGTKVYMDNVFFWKPNNVPTISNFSIAGKYYGDPAFVLPTPTSNSAGTFTYSSNNPAVATVSGNVVTITGVGTATITATQAAFAPFLSGSVTAILNVDFAPPVTAAPQPPVRNAGDVISLFSNSYTNVPVDTWSASWDMANVADVQIGGNDNKKYTSLVFSGIEFTSNPVDASAMTTFHLDAWTPDATVFKIKLVDFGANGSYGGGDDTEHELTYTPTLSGWNTYDIPMSSFTGLAARAHLAQMILVASTSTVYVDNVYFYKGTALSPTIVVTQPNCVTTTGTITVTSPTTGLMFSKDGTVYQSSGVFSSLPVGTYSITSKTAGGTVSSAAVATIIGTTPPAPAGIVGTRNVSKCDTLQTYSVINPVYGYTYTWAVTGTGNTIISGQGSPTAVIDFAIGGTITVKAAKCGTSGPTASFAVTKATPAAPATVTYTSTNVCSYTNSAFAVTGIKDTFKIKPVLYATGYIFQAPGGATVQKLNDTTYTVLFADTTTLSTTSPRYVKVYSLSACDTSLAKVVTLTRTAAVTPAGIYNSFNANSTSGPAAVTSVCGIVGGSATTYKIRRVASAITYAWSVKSGANMIVTHENAAGGIYDTAISVQYLSGFVTDSIFVRSINGCGASVAKGIKVAATTPVAPATLTITSLGTTNCGQPRYRYTGPATLPAATATLGAATAWQWSFYGPVGSTFVVDSGSLSTSTVTGYYTNLSARGLGDTVKLRYASACGFSPYKVLALTNVASSTNPPAVPASISATLVADSCGARIYRYTAPVLPVGTATNATPNGYLWSMPTGSAVALSATLDSGALSGAGARIIRLKFANNGAAVTGDSLKVRYTSACGVGSYKALKLTNLAKVCLLGAPAYSKTFNGNDVINAEIFPNPNNGNFTLNVQTGIMSAATAKVQIVDMYGRVVNQFTAQNNNGMIHMNIADGKLVNGFYSVRYSVGTISNSIKMMIRK